MKELGQNEPQTDTSKKKGNIIHRQNSNVVFKAKPNIVHPWLQNIKKRKFKFLIARNNTPGGNFSANDLRITIICSGNGILTRSD